MPKWATEAGGLLGYWGKTNIAYKTDNKKQYMWINKRSIEKIRRVQKRSDLLAVSSCKVKRTERFNCHSCP